MIVAAKQFPRRDKFSIYLSEWTVIYCTDTDGNLSILLSMSSNTFLILCSVAHQYQYVMGWQAGSDPIRIPILKCSIDMFWMIIPCFELHPSSRLLVLETFLGSPVKTSASIIMWCAQKDVCILRHQNGTIRHQSVHKIKQKCPVMLSLYQCDDSCHLVVINAIRRETERQ